jgi:hypothetical protein
VHASGGDAGDGPFFFLSYARSHRQHELETNDPDQLISRVFKDLCGHTSDETGRPAGSVGFMDRVGQPVNEWPWYLPRNLATCRIFVPLYSKRYFKSEHCGREWFAFHRRALNHAAANGAGQVETIVPALWVPIRDGRFPEATRSVQFRPEASARSTPSTASTGS